MGYLDETLRRLGASEAQIKSSTAKLFEKAMLEDSGFCEKVAADALERIAKSVTAATANASYIDDKCKEALNGAIAYAEKFEQGLKAEIASYEDQRKKCEAYIQQNKSAVIYDADLSEAVKAYKAVLAATKEVFGESSNSPEAIVAAINAGSYIAWRGIMGPAANSNGFQVQNIKVNGGRRAL